ncbi:uncharacterized protein DUF1493 [Chitinophaga skermanii]|uniref:Uncharacterized protein DUF1493 n=1 Tax=Chitinophaga skermanii TaxID=331697 RepID=A0A327QR41_9BACT|nr:DUF1493 family protein [Chitinophaga skermanii]RAJ06790.1 uncharacterized protein DUF1493 [Chitinophaga skermanii]
MTDFLSVNTLYIVILGIIAVCMAYILVSIRRRSKRADAVLFECENGHPKEEELTNYEERVLQFFIDKSNANKGRIHIGTEFHFHLGFTHAKAVEVLKAFSDAFHVELVGFNFERDFVEDSKFTFNPYLMQFVVAAESKCLYYNNTIKRHVNWHVADSPNEYRIMISDHIDAYVGYPVLLQGDDLIKVRCDVMGQQAMNLLISITETFCIDITGYDIKTFGFADETQVDRYSDFTLNDLAIAAHEGFLVETRPLVFNNEFEPKFMQQIPIVHDYIAATLSIPSQKLHLSTYIKSHFAGDQAAFEKFMQGFYEHFNVKPPQPFTAEDWKIYDPLNYDLVLSAADQVCNITLSRKIFTDYGWFEIWEQMEVWILSYFEGKIMSITPQTELAKDLQLSGHDADIFIIRIAERFMIDIHDYKYDNHFGSTSNTPITLHDIWGMIVEGKWIQPE